MSPFLGSNGKVYRGHIHDREGRRYIRSLGTRNKREAMLVESFIKRCRERRDWRTLDAIIGGTVNAGDAYFAAQDGTLPELLEAKAEAASIAAVPDLDKLAREWAPLARSPKYVTQVRRMIPEGTRYPVTDFTRAAISKHLASLTCSEPTKNRHRVALSQFARWLVERDYLRANPVRDVRGFRERDPRMVFYTREEAQAVIRRLPHYHAALEALMCGAGLEWGALSTVRRRDFNTDTREVSVRGTKTRWRTRTVRVTEAWCWAIVEKFLRDFMPDAAPFEELTERESLRMHKLACKDAGVAPSTLHDWRHTYAIQALKDGLPAQTVKRQLGHSPHSTMLERVYSAWIPKGDADYLATNLATPPAKQTDNRRHG